MAYPRFWDPRGVCQLHVSTLHWYMQVHINSVVRAPAAKAGGPPWV